MKYNITCKFINKALSSLGKDYLKTNYSAIYKSLRKNIGKEFKAIIERVPIYNGKKTTMMLNIPLGGYFFACAKVIPGITPSILDSYIDFIMNQEFLSKLFKKARIKGTMFSEKSFAKKAKDSKLSEEIDNPYDWTYKFTPGNDEFYFTFTKCGLCKLAKQENLEQFLPCLCRIDYANFKLHGANLFRTKTLAKGNDCCDFHLVKIK